MAAEEGGAKPGESEYYALARDAIVAEAVNTMQTLV